MDILKKFHLNIPIVYHDANEWKDRFGHAELDTIGDWIYLSNKTRCKKVKPISIHLMRGDPEIKDTLLHEIAHCLCMYQERKVKGVWVPIFHGHLFEAKFRDVIREGAGMVYRAN